jgi:outer membrane receptor protein involved in Fe transport
VHRIDAGVHGQLAAAEYRRPESPHQRTHLDRRHQGDVYLAAAGGLPAGPRRLGLAQLHQSRQHHGAGLAFTTNGGAWRFSLDGKNLLDRWYRVAGYDFGGTGSGLLANVSQIGFYGPPRTYQVTAQYHY